MNKTRLIPFDAEKAKKGAKVVTRCGYPVRIGFYDIKGTSFPILGAVTEEENTEVVLSFTKDGCYTSLDVKNDYDLFIEEEEEETDYNPYKETVKSISDMVERYSDADSDLQDFYDNVKVKCKNAFTYERIWLNKQKEQKPSDKVKIRRMTNQELSLWLRECPEEHRESSHEDRRYVHYFSDDANVKVDDGILIRRNGGE